MEKLFDINEKGHSIRCIEYYGGDLRKVSRWVVATHGFGGSKENNAVKKFAEKIISKYHGFGVVCFDWPCHGKDGRSHMVLSECLDYLDIVNHFLKNERSAEKLYNYSVSFGAYITLLYIHESKNPYERIALRSPAVNMYKSLSGGMSDEQKELLLKKGKVKLDSENKKAARGITVTSDFLNDLKSHDIRTYEYFDDAESIIIIHGTKDRTVPIEESEKFADDNVIELIPVENADHPFTNPGYMDFAIQKIIHFFGS